MQYVSAGEVGRGSASRYELGSLNTHETVTIAQGREASPPLRVGKVRHAGGLLTEDAFAADRGELV